MLAHYGTVLLLSSIILTVLLVIRHRRTPSSKGSFDTTVAMLLFLTLLSGTGLMTLVTLVLS